MSNPKWSYNNSQWSRGWLCDSFGIGCKNRPAYRINQPKVSARGNRALITRIAKQVKQQQPEDQWLQTAASGNVTDATTGGFIQCLSEIPQATTASSVSTRIGNEVRPKALQIRLTCRLNALGTASNVRLMLLWLGNNGGTAPIIGNILETGPGLTVLSPRRINCGIKARILHDEIFSLIDVKDKVVSRNIFRKLKGTTTFFGAGATNYADGHYWLIAFSDEPSYFPTITYNAMLKYTE